MRTGASLNAAQVKYLYDGSNVLIERDGSGNTTKTYTRGVGLPGGIGGLIAQNYTISGSPVVQYAHYDDRGSVANLMGTSSTGYSYDAFGNLLTAPTTGDTNRYLFSTKEFDS